MRITIACPAAFRSDANQLAMVLGYGPPDAETYVGLNWQDAGGSLYACASLIVSDTFTTTAQSGLQRPHGTPTATSTWQGLIAHKRCWCSARRL